MTFDKLCKFAGLGQHEIILQLAEYLDYDVSYIKAVGNDLKLPFSVRSNSELFRKIIRFILKDCTDQHHVALCHAFNIDLSLSEHSFEEKCIAVLEAAYKESYRIKNSVHTSPASHIINNCNFSQLDMSFESNNSLLAQVTSEIAKQTTDAVLECISMPFSSDYGNNECIPFWMNMVQNLSSNTTLHLRMITDLSDPAIAYTSAGIYVLFIVCRIQIYPWNFTILTTPFSLTKVCLY